MKISINTKIVEGPYGGGMQFVKFLKDFLQKEGNEIIHDLKDDNIDIILHISPFPPLSQNSKYSFFDAYLYKLKHPKTVIAQRVNECDERKGLKNRINKPIVRASKYSDFIIFIASWLKPLFEKQGLDTKKPSRVILNGGDKNIFNSENKKLWDKQEKLKIVTHHWGATYLKGHDFYQKLDTLLETKNLKNKFEFTFIGNYPKNLKYKNTKLIPPLSGKELAEELKKHHIYIIASKNEPGGMSHIEGALCGMPLLYIDSGSLPEYCKNFGLEISLDNFEEKLKEIRENYDFWIEKIKNYDNTAQKMATSYYELFKEIHENNEDFEIKNTIFIRYIKYYYLYIYSFFFMIIWKSYLKIRKKLSSWKFFIIHTLK